MKFGTLLLVDPDNRRAVDYIRRRKALQTMNEFQSPSFTDIANDLTKNPGDGRIKMFLIWKALGVRQQYPDLFDNGEYLQLTVRGKKASHAVAFARSKPRRLGHCARACGEVAGWYRRSTDREDRMERYQRSFAVSSKQLRNAFTDERIDPRVTGNTSEFAMSEGLATFPVALFVSQ